MEDECGNHSDFWYKYQTATWLISYYGLYPLYMTIGLAGNVTLLIAFYIQSKKESAYSYQVMLTVAKTFEILTFGGFVFFFHLSMGLGGPEGTHIAWVRKTYWIMFLFNRVVHPLGKGSTAWSLLCAVAMAADRVFALRKPLQYSKKNHTRDLLIAAVVCFVLAMASSVQDAWLDDIVADGDHFDLTFYIPYLTQPAIQALTTIRTIIRLGGLFILFGLSAAIIVFYRRRNKRVVNMAADSEERKAASNAADRTLILLNGYQLLLMCISQIGPAVYIVLANFQVPWFLCQEPLFPQLVDGMVFVSDAIDVFVILAINKKMRRVVARAYPCTSKYGAVQQANKCNTK